MLTCSFIRWINSWMIRRGSLLLWRMRHYLGYWMGCFRLVLEQTRSLGWGYHGHWIELAYFWADIITYMHYFQNPRISTFKDFSEFSRLCILVKYWVSVSSFGFMVLVSVLGTLALHVMDTSGEDRHRKISTIRQSRRGPPCALSSKELSSKPSNDVESIIQPV